MIKLKNVCQCPVHAVKIIAIFLSGIILDICIEKLKLTLNQLRIKQIEKDIWKHFKK